MHWDDLGGYVALAEHVPPEVIADVADVRALDRLAAGRGGHLIVATLHAVCTTDSIRDRRTPCTCTTARSPPACSGPRTSWGFGAHAAGRSRLALALTLRHLRDHPA